MGSSEKIEGALNDCDMNLNEEDLETNIDLFQTALTSSDENADAEIEPISKYDVISSKSKVRICKKCGDTFTVLKKYKAHLMTHYQHVQVTCNDCGKSIKSNRFLEHVMIHTGEKPHVCTICGRGFRIKSDLRQHTFTHTGERPYPCYFCDKKFTDASSRNKHVKIHTGEKGYACEICQKAFTQIAALREHQVTHTRERLHLCELCSKGFSTKSSMKRHMLTHMNTCEDCGKTFKKEVQLQRHRELHNLERPFSCQLCLRRFLKNADLTNHLLFHNSESLIVCTICSKTFRNYPLLRHHHYRFHKDADYPFPCEWCKKGFFQKESYEKHLTWHSNPSKNRVQCSGCHMYFPAGSLNDHNCFFPTVEELNSSNSCEITSDLARNSLILCDKLITNEIE